MRLTIFRTLSVFAVLFVLAGLGVGCSGRSDSSAAPAETPGRDTAVVASPSPSPEATPTPSSEYRAETARLKRIEVLIAILNRPHPSQWELEMRGQDGICDTLERGQVAVELVEERARGAVNDVEEDLLDAAKIAVKLLRRPEQRSCVIRDIARRLDDAGYMFDTIHDTLKAAEKEPKDIGETSEELRKALLDRVRTALAGKNSHDEVPTWVEETLVSWPIAPRDIGISAEKLAELIPGGH